MTRRRVRWGARAGFAGIALFLVAAPSSAIAATWGNQVEFGDIHQLGPSVDVSEDGTARMVKGAGGGRVEVLSVARGSNKARRCVVPDSSKRASTIASGVSPSGAMAVAWLVRDGDDLRLRATSAAPGRCFARPKTLSTTGRTTSLGWTIAGPKSTVLVTWREHRGADLDPLTRFAAGPAGGTFAKARTLTPQGQTPREVVPVFIRDDRVEWSWATREGSTSRQWAATSAPRAGKVGRPLEVAKHVEPGNDPTPSPVYGSLLTTRAGRQLAELKLDGTLYIWSRRPGRVFGAAQTVAIPPTGTLYDGSSAINASGDAVFAVEEDDEIYAVVRRRDGRLSPLHHLTPGDSPRVAADPETAIDGAGRAVVVWRAQDASHEQIADSEIRTAVADTKGRFGPATALSSPGPFSDRSPYVATDSRGRAAIVWTRERGEQSVLQLVRGRLGD